MYPAYDYKCRTCATVFETRHSMFSEDPVHCPNCDSEDTQKIISAPVSVLDWRDSDSVHASTRFRGAVKNRTLHSAGG